MESSHIHIPIELAQIITYVMMLLTIVLLTILYNKHGHSMIQGLKGHNNRWDAPEIIIASFMPVALVMVFMDVFLGMHSSSEAWLFIGSSLGIGSGSRAYVERGAVKSNRYSKEERSNEG